MQTPMKQDHLFGNEIAVRLIRALRIVLKCDPAADEHQLLQSVCDILVEDGGFRVAWVGYVEPDAQKTIRPVAQAGKGILRNMKLPSSEAGSEDAANVAIRTSQICRIPYVHNQPTQEPISDGSSEHYLTSVLSLPLKSDGQTFGALTLCAGDPHQFEQHTVTLLEEWSELFAHAVIAARKTALCADVTLALSRQNTMHAILHQCAEALVHHLDVAFARIWTLNNDERVLRL
ncbi:GAF domain-containing protein, partial [bacterium]|nr:GAF domain-containing protein [bacterium]